MYGKPALAKVSMILPNLAKALAPPDALSGLISYHSILGRSERTFTPNLGGLEQRIVFADSVELPA